MIARTPPTISVWISRRQLAAVNQTRGVRHHRRAHMCNRSGMEVNLWGLDLVSKISIYRTQESGCFYKSMVRSAFAGRNFTRYVTTFIKLPQDCNKKFDTPWWEEIAPLMDCYILVVFVVGWDKILTTKITSSQSGVETNVMPAGQGISYPRLWGVAVQSVRRFLISPMSDIHILCNQKSRRISKQWFRMHLSFGCK
jgi:hypothetical protein